jgi:hypothetical protein
MHYSYAIRFHGMKGDGQVMHKNKTTIFFSLFHTEWSYAQKLTIQTYKKNFIFE